MHVIHYINENLEGPLKYLDDFSSRNIPSKIILWNWLLTATNKSNGKNWSKSLMRNPTISTCMQTTGKEATNFDCCARLFGHIYCSPYVHSAADRDGAWFTMFSQSDQWLTVISYSNLLTTLISCMCLKQSVPDATGNLQRLLLISYHYKFGDSTRTESWRPIVQL
jgi:hypothetical protein